MREILFRAKKESGDGWAEGLPVHDINGALTEFEVYKGFCDCGTVKIDPETIGQYTGFKDANERKIFEGDILCTDTDEENLLVRWDTDSAGFVLEGEGAEMSFDGYWGWQLEIIGNISDNPELWR